MILFKTISDDRKEKHSDKFQQRAGRVFPSFDQKQAPLQVYAVATGEGGWLLGTVNGSWNSALLLS